MPPAALPPSRLSHCPPRPQSPHTPTTDAAGDPLARRYPVSMGVTAMTLHRVSVVWVFSSDFPLVSIGFDSPGTLPLSPDTSMWTWSEGMDRTSLSVPW